MKKALFILIILSSLTACKKNLTDLNVDPKHPLIVPSYTLFTNAERSLSNDVTSANVNTNIFRLIEQQWTETTYLNETQYQITNRNQPDQIWSDFYTTQLFTFERAKKLMATDVTDSGTLTNEVAITDILEVYSYYYLVTTFGNIPYTQALDITHAFPAYDDAKTIYYDLLSRLDTDIAALDPNSGSFGSADIIYAGDPGMWKKFANSLKLKMGITIADYDNTKAKSVVESAVSSGVFTSNADNALFRYVSSPPNTNPVWVDLVQSQRHDFVGTSQFINLMYPNTENQDPRLPYYFAQNSDGVYLGADNGSGSGQIVYTDYSLPSGSILNPGTIGKLTNPDFPGLLLDYAETEFNLAEAAFRGYNVGEGSIESHYDNAITASITYWGGSSSDASNYLQLTDVAYSTAIGSTPLQKIAEQEYLALYNRGWDAWIVQRRLKYPVLLPPPNAFSDFPIRFTYPISEQNGNPINYQNAAAAIGGDLVTTKLFFIK